MEYFTENDYLRPTSKVMRAIERQFDIKREEKEIRYKKAIESQNELEKHWDKLKRSRERSKKYLYFILIGLTVLILIMVLFLHDQYGIRFTAKGSKSNILIFDYLFGEGVSMRLFEIFDRIINVIAAPIMIGLMLFELQRFNDQSEQFNSKHVEIISQISDQGLEDPILTKDMSEVSSIAQKYNETHMKHLSNIIEVSDEELFTMLCDFERKELIVKGLWEKYIS